MYPSLPFIMNLLNLYYPSRNFFWGGRGGRGKGWDWVEAKHMQHTKILALLLSS